MEEKINLRKDIIELYYESELDKVQYYIMINKEDYNRDLAIELAYEIFSHWMGELSDPEDLADIIEKFLNNYE